MTLLEKLAELEKIASEASQETWVPRCFVGTIDDESVMFAHGPIFLKTNENFLGLEKDMDHIVAFQPKEVLKLIADFRKHIEALKDAREALEEMALTPWPDSSAISLLEWYSARAKAVLGQSLERWP